MNERTTIDLPLWEQYLVYATAFGISNKVTKALKIRCSEISTSPVLSSPYYHSRAFRSTTRSFNVAIRHAHNINISHSTSGGFGHSGYRRRWSWWRWPDGGGH